MRNNLHGKIGTESGEIIDAQDIGTPFVLGSFSAPQTVPELIDPSDGSKEIRDREEFVSKQALTRAVQERLPTSDIVDQLVREIIEEITYLKYDRQKAIREGRNTVNLSVSRISSLKQLADVLMKRMENARAEQLDLKSPRFREVLKLWMEFVYESMQKTNVPDEIVDLVFKQMEADMIDWEKRVLDTVG